MAMAYFPRRLEGLLLLGLMSASAVAPASAQVGTPIRQPRRSGFSV